MAAVFDDQVGLVDDQAPRTRRVRLLRRLAGLSPSYANGILVCPTGANSVVAVDLATRALLWGYRFKRSVRGDDPNRQQQLFMMRNGAYMPGSPVVPEVGISTEKAWALTEIPGPSRTSWPPLAI